MLRIWWDIKGVIYYDLLPENQTIDAAKYCKQLDRLREAAEAPRIVQQDGRDFPLELSITMESYYLRLQCQATHVFAHPQKTTRVFPGCFVALFV